MGLPKPYYEEPGIVIYNNDCRDILPYLEPVDLVLTDPPYGIEWQSNWNGGSFGKIYGDGLIDGKWIELLKSSVLYCFTRRDVMQIWVDLIQKSISVRDVLVWDKLSHGAGNINSWAPCYEMIIFASKDSPKLVGSRPQNVLRHWRVDGGATGMSTKNLLSHPDEKPIALITDILQKHEGSVLDPFMGSGTTLRAAKDLGRKAIGIEIEKKYCDIAIKRLQQEVFDFGK